MPYSVVAPMLIQRRSARDPECGILESTDAARRLQEQQGPPPAAVLDDVVQDRHHEDSDDSSSSDGSSEHSLVKGTSDISLGPSSYHRSGPASDDDDASTSTAPPSKEERLLQQLCPKATSVECRRFAAAEHGRGGGGGSSEGAAAAARKLASYLEWRESHGSIPSARDDESDEDVWNRCARAAFAAEKKKGGAGEERADGNQAEEVLLPRIVRILGSECNGGGLGDGSNDGSNGPMSPAVRDLDGKRTLHILIAMVDNAVASPSTYALCTALYIDSVLRRDSSERMTILVDVRPGMGWANPSPLTIVPYAKMMSRIGADHFPGRLWRVVVFPMPKAAVWIWKAMKGVLDKRHTARVRLVSGPAQKRSPVPEKKMREYFGHDAIEVMEQSRLASFR